MKVLIVFDEAHADNLFVPVLCRAIRQQGVDIRCSRQEFWTGDTPFDIIHFQWPEEVVGWNCNDPEILTGLKERIARYRAEGTRFVYTRHNQCPHYANSIMAQAYTIIEACSDVIVHMGRYSHDELRKKYPQKNHVVIPHHIYENTYDETITCAEARRRLNIPADRFVITAFGKFRKREETAMVLRAYLRSGIRHKYLLAPRLYPFTRHPHHNGLKQIAAWFLWHLVIPAGNKLFGIRADNNEQIIPNEDLPYYLAASDLIFIQRRHILNSGNVPLAFLFRKVAVGPDCGNVGELLRATGNPVFDPENPATVREALQKARELHRAGQGETNYRYALRHMSLEKVGQMYANMYQELNLSV